MSKLLNRDAILKSNDIETEEVYIKEWGGTVLVKALTGKERDQFERDSMVFNQVQGKTKAEMKDNIRARLVAITVVDEKHSPLFKKADIEALGGKSAKAINKIYNVASKLSGITEDDVDELVKNSEETQEGDSTSA